MGEAPESASAVIVRDEEVTVFPEWHREETAPQLTGHLRSRCGLLSDSPREGTREQGGAVGPNIQRGLRRSHSRNQPSPPATIPEQSL